MNKLSFTRVVEKTRGLFTYSPSPWRKLLLTQDTMSYTILSSRTFIPTMLEDERERVQGPVYFYGTYYLTFDDLTQVNSHT